MVDSPTPGFDAASAPMSATTSQPLAQPLAQTKDSPTPGFDAAATPVSQTTPPEQQPGFWNNATHGLAHGFETETAPFVNPILDRMNQAARYMDDRVPALAKLDQYANFKNPTVEQGNALAAKSEDEYQKKYGASDVAGWGDTIGTVAATAPLLGPVARLGAEATAAGVGLAARAGANSFIQGGIRAVGGAATGGTVGATAADLTGGDPVEGLKFGAATAGLGTAVKTFADLSPTTKQLLAVAGGLGSGWAVGGDPLHLIAGGTVGKAASEIAKVFGPGAGNFAHELLTRYATTPAGVYGGKHGNQLEAISPWGQ